MDVVAGRAYTNERRPIRHLDVVMLLTVLALALIGLLAIYSATHQSLREIHADTGYYVKRQITFLALGAVVLLGAASFDYRFLKVYAGVIYVSSLVLLVLVRTPLGSTVKGSQRWFQFLGFQLALFLSQLAQQRRQQTAPGLLGQVSRYSGHLSKK